jgi:hypothetical protein
MQRWTTFQTAKLSVWVHLRGSRTREETQIRLQLPTAPTRPCISSAAKKFYAIFMSKSLERSIILVKSLQIANNLNLVPTIRRQVLEGPIQPSSTHHSRPPKVTVSWFTCAGEATGLVRCLTPSSTPLHPRESAQGRGHRRRARPRRTCQAARARAREPSKKCDLPQVNKTWR